MSYSWVTAHHCHTWGLRRPDSGRGSAFTPILLFSEHFLTLQPDKMLRAAQLGISLPSPESATSPKSLVLHWRMVFRDRIWALVCPFTPAVSRATSYQGGNLPGGTPGFPGLVQTVCYLPQASRPREMGLHSPGIPLGGHICICKRLGPCPPRLPAVLSQISTALLWNSTGTGTCSGSKEHAIRRVVTQKGRLSRCYSGPQSCGTQTVWN